MHCELDGSAHPSSRSGYLRGFSLIALLLVEIVGLSIYFDSGSLPDNSVWSELIGWSPQFMQIAISVAAALMVFQSDGLQRAGRRFMDLVSELHERWFWWLALHLVSTAVFVVLTGAMLASQLESRWNASTFGAAWIVLATVVGATWAIALLPASTWGRLVRANARTLAVGLFTGLVATAIAFATTQLWKPLGQSTLYLVSSLLELFQFDVICDSAKRIIGTQEFSVRIAPACSGYEGIGLIEVFLAVYLWVHRSEFRFPQALLLMPLGAVIIWFANVARIFALLVIGSSFSREIARSGFHSQAGWIGFNIVALGLVVLSGRLPMLAARRSKSADAQPTNPAAPLLMPFLAILAATLITASLTTGFNVLYPARIAAALLVLAYYGRAYQQMDWRCSWHWVVVGGITCVLWMLLVTPIIDHGHSPLTGWSDLPAGYRWIWIVCRVVGYVAVIPLVEELAFRGYLLRRLVDFDFQDVPPSRFTWFSFVGSSLLFGIMHGQCWVAGTIAGMLFACSLYRRGRLADAVLAHALTNASLAAYACYSGEWWLIS